VLGPCKSVGSKEPSVTAIAIPAQIPEAKLVSNLQGIQYRVVPIAGMYCTKMRLLHL
jgi:hypothetical protein